MLRNFITLFGLIGLNSLALSVAAQTTETRSPAVSTAYSAPVKNPDYCINIMAEFPTDNHEVRYQFFRLTQEMSRDITPNFRIAIDKYGAGNLDTGSSMLGAIEDIANPVLRQAAPEITIANMAYVMDFASACEPLITGQINSLKAYDLALEDTEFNTVIVEDALFLRQILSDSMFRLGAHKDPLYSTSVNQYADALVTTRDEVEFVSFEDELNELEAIYMIDLDGRLKRSNDLINEEMDTEVLSNSVALSDSFRKAEETKAKQRQLFTLSRILGGRR